MSLGVFVTSLLMFGSEPVEFRRPDPVADADQAPPEVGPGHHTGDVGGYLRANAGQYREAIDRAQVWLDQLRVDPFELRAHGLKGKKKLVELLETYVILHRAAGPREKPALLARIRQVAAITYEPRYHDMSRLSDLAFKQDATSYLRAAYLLNQLGLDTTLYRREILAIEPRLTGHLRTRGAHQRMAFESYYDYFDLAAPPDLDAGFAAGIIYHRRDPKLMTTTEVYQLTHEVFVPYRFGEDLEADFFDGTEKLYLLAALDVLTRRYIDHDDVDVVGELLSCMRLLRLVDLPIYGEGLEYLLRTQNADGSWGKYERYRKQYGDLVKQGYYLHTTEVVLGALTLAFGAPL
jgi:hypothetical protein